MKSHRTITRAGSALHDCYDCGAHPGQLHCPGCDIERCSVCGGQRLQCGCKGHDRAFSRWTGIWPGSAESAALGIDLNEFHRRGLNCVFFVKPNASGEEREPRKGTNA